MGYLLVHYRLDQRAHGRQIWTCLWRWVEQAQTYHVGAVSRIAFVDISRRSRTHRARACAGRYLITQEAAERALTNSFALLLRCVRCCFGHRSSDGRTNGRFGCGGRRSPPPTLYFLNNGWTTNNSIIQDELSVMQTW